MKKLSHVVVKKLQQIITTEKDNQIVVDAANALAKYLPKPESPKKPRGKPPLPKEPKEPNIHDLVAVMEKRRKGSPLTDEEKQMAADMDAAIERKRKEPPNSLNGG